MSFSTEHVGSSTWCLVASLPEADIQKRNYQDALAVVGTIISCLRAFTAIECTDKIAIECTDLQLIWSLHFSSSGLAGLTGLFL
jgi:hypothetical protein